MNILIYYILYINNLLIFIFQKSFYLRYLDDENLFKHFSLMPQPHFIQHKIKHAYPNDDFYFLPFFLFLFHVIWHFIFFLYYFPLFFILVTQIIQVFLLYVVLLNLIYIIIPTSFLFINLSFSIILFNFCYVFELNIFWLLSYFSYSSEFTNVT